MKPICRICSSHDSIFLFYAINTHGRHEINKKEKYPLYKCQKCGCLFLKGIKTDKKYYKDNYKAGYYVDSKKPSFLELTWSLFVRILVYFKIRFLVNSVNTEVSLSKIKILDIGCGNGDFLANLPNTKFDKFGLEINSEGVKKTRLKGIKVFSESIEKADFQGTKFNIITLWHVFEHLENPKDTLNKIKSILSKKGTLIIQVPNSESLGFKLGKRNWFHLDSPRHLQIPSKKSMEIILSQTGFKIVKVKNFPLDYPLDLFWSVRCNPLRFPIYLFYVFIKFFTFEHSTYIIINK